MDEEKGDGRGGIGLLVFIKESHSLLHSCNILLFFFWFGIFTLYMDLSFTFR